MTWVNRPSPISWARSNPGRADSCAMSEPATLVSGKRPTRNRPVVVCAEVSESTENSPQSFAASRDPETVAESSPGQVCPPEELGVSGLEHHLSEVPALVNVLMSLDRAVAGEREGPVYNRAELAVHHTSENLPEVFAQKLLLVMQMQEIILSVNITVVWALMTLTHHCFQ